LPGPFSLSPPASAAPRDGSPAAFGTAPQHLDPLGGQRLGLVGRNFLGLRQSLERPRPYYTLMRQLPVAELGDEGLLAGVAQGDNEAMLAFVRRYQKRVFGLAYSMLGDPGAAEEVAQ